MNHFYELNDNQQMLIVFIITLIFSRPILSIICGISYNIFMCFRNVFSKAVAKEFNTMSFTDHVLSVKSYRFEDSEAGYLTKSITLHQAILDLNKKVKALEEKK